jgi:hypothetical protein
MKSWWKISLSDLLIVIFTAVIAFYARLQWLEMHAGGEQTTEMVKAAKKQAEAADSFSQSAQHVSADIGTAQRNFQRMAESSEKSIGATQNSMRLEQRAWVGMADTQVNGDAVTVFFTNTGRTPALEVAPGEGGGSDSWCCDLNMVHYQPLKHTPANAGRTLVSRAAMPVTHVVPAVPNTATPDQRKKVVSVIQGSIVYKDVFKRAHWTDYCLCATGPKPFKFTFCPDRNDTDDNPETYPKEGRKFSCPEYSPLLPQ